MTSTLNYYTARFTDEMGCHIEDFSDEEFFCHDGCLEAAYESLLDRNWMPWPLDTSMLIGGPTYGGHGSEGSVWVVAPTTYADDGSEWYGGSPLCGACGSEVFSANRG